MRSREQQLIGLQQEVAELRSTVDVRLKELEVKVKDRGLGIHVFDGLPHIFGQKVMIMSYNFGKMVQNISLFIQWTTAHPVDISILPC